MKRRVHRVALSHASTCTLVEAGGRTPSLHCAFHLTVERSPETDLGLQELLIKCAQLFICKSSGAPA